MANIACLLPRAEMTEQAHQIVQEMQIPDVVDISYGSSEDAIEWAQRVARQGADIVIARGLQATYIKQTVSLPVVEIRLTAQEIGLLIQRGRKSLGAKKHPICGIVGYANQFCNMDDFPELFDVELRTYFVEKGNTDPGKLQSLAQQAVDDRPDFLIGGDTLLEEAKHAKIPGLFLSGAGDSFREALRTARLMAYGLDQEKRNTEEMKTLLDNSFGAMVRLDPEGCVTLLNFVAENLFGWQPSEVLGRPIGELCAGIDDPMLQEALVEGRETYSKYLLVNKVSVVANLSPVRAGEEIVGAIFSAQEVKRLEDLGTVARKELYWRGHVAKGSFENMEEPSALMRQTVSLARQYARSNAPIFLYSEPGNGQSRFAQAIHNASDRKNGPFVAVNCAQDAQEGQLAMLFGVHTGSERTEGVLAQAHQGTVFLEEIERLTSPCQHRLMALIKDKAMLGGDQRMLPVDVRIIVSSNDDLGKLVEERQFSQELYYLLNNLFLELPSLRRRPEDIGYWVEHYVTQLGKHYKRYIALTVGAKTKLCGYPWKGNLTQLASFCERLVLTTPRRSTDENDIDRLYLQMYPITLYNLPTPSAVVYKDPEAALIAGLLEKHSGSRSAVAQELGISTTTLWRKIKKHGIANRFEI